MSNAAVAAGKDAKRATLRLRHIGPVAMRTPAFPAGVLHALHAAADGPRALYDALRGNPDHWAVIAIASPSLGEAAARWIARPFEPDERIATSLYAYFARCSLRATPFAACATVGTVDFNSTGAPLQCSTMHIRARPDAEWLHLAGQALEADAAAFEHLVLRPSGLVHEIGGRLEVADVARAELRSVGAMRSLVPIPTAFNATAAVSALMAHYAPGLTVGELAGRVARALGVETRDVIALVAQLTAIGVFITEGRPALGDRPADVLARAYHRCAPERGAIFDEFRSTLTQVSDADLRDVPPILATSRAIASRIAEAPHVAQVDALRTYTGSLPQSLLEHLGSTIGKLAEISPQTREPRLLAHGFRLKYNAGRYVPLLELLDPSEGLAFEALLSAPDAAADKLDAALAEIAMQAAVERTAEVALDGEPYAKLCAARGDRDGDFRLPAHLEAIAVLRQTPNGLGAALTGRVFEGRSTSLGRFADLIVADVPDELDAGTIVAEFIGTPHLRRSANVANQSTRTAYVFCCGASSDRDAEHTITPADVIVGCEEDRLVMRIRTSGALLRVRFSHRLNAGFASRLAAFVQYISLTDLAVVGVPWGRVSGALPFRPRLTLGGTIVAPAQWRIPASIAADMSGPAARAWRERWMLPGLFEIAEIDNHLAVDIRSSLACAYVRKVAQRVPVIAATELIPAFDDAAVDGPGGRYVAEIAVTYAVRAASAPRAPAPAPMTAARATSVDALRAPGSDWIFAKLYMGAERMNHFLQRETPALHGFAQAAQDWHFVRFADPDQHLRVRFRVDDDARRSSLIIELYAWFNRLIEARRLRRVAIDTYDREVERYGGPARIAVAERLFSADSAAAMALLRDVRRGRDADAWLAADVTSFAIALTGDAARTKAMLRASLPERRKLPRESWDVVRCARTMLEIERYAAIAVLGKALLADIAPLAAGEIANAVLHMHCNRVGLTGEAERYIRAVSAGICEGLLHERPD